MGQDYSYSQLPHVRANREHNARVDQEMRSEIAANRGRWPKINKALNDSEMTFRLIFDGELKNRHPNRDGRFVVTVSDYMPDYTSYKEGDKFLGKICICGQMVDVYNHVKVVTPGRNIIHGYGEAMRPICAIDLAEQSLDFNQSVGEMYRQSDDLYHPLPKNSYLWRIDQSLRFFSQPDILFGPGIHPSSRHSKGCFWGNSQNLFESLARIFCDDSTYVG